MLAQVAAAYSKADNGEHRIAVNTGWTNTHISALAIDPVTPTTLYAATEDGGVFAIQQEGFKYRTLHAPCLARPVRPGPTTLAGCVSSHKQQTLRGIGEKSNVLAYVRQPIG
jgi:hypothetical protein